MATLGKIRSKGILLVVVVGLALLAFIIGDFLNSSTSYFNKSRERVAQIAGENINIRQFSDAIEQMTQVYKIETGQTELNEDVISQIRTSVWESLVNEIILNKEAQKLGLTISQEELSDQLIGNNIHPLILQRGIFVNENGQFSRSLLIQFLNSLDATPTSNEMKQQIDMAKNYWLFWEKNVKNSILQEKYNKLLTSTVTANSVDAKMNYEARKFTVDSWYVVQPYFAVPDSLVTVTASEIRARYNKQKEFFKQEENCSIDYVVFDIKPSPEDFKEVEQWINRLSEEFRTTTDIIGLVNSNSDIIYDGRAYSEQTIPPMLKDFAFKGKVGDVFGPVFENDTYIMARIMETGIMQPDSVKLRHIFLPKSEEAKADSIIQAIRSGADFASLAKKYSAVPQTAANGGEIGWLTYDIRGIDKEILENAFNKPLNEVFTIKNAQGTQIMQVTAKTTPKKKVKVAILQRKVTPSSKTYSLIYNQAKQFAAENNAELFAKRAQEKGYIVHHAEKVLKNDNQLQTISNSRQIIRWAFQSRKGSVSDVFDCDNQYVVAMVTEKNQKGYQPIEKVSAQLKSEIIKDKKADLMIKNISAQLKKAPMLEDLASTLGTEVKTAEAINFTSYQFGLAGFEPYIIGKATVIPLDKISDPYKGNAGVYVLKTSNKQENQEPFNVKNEISQLNSRYLYSLFYAVMDNLREKSEIVDNRSNFY